MAAMSFAVVGEGEDARNTRERALKSDRDESHPLLSFGCPRNVAVSETIYAWRNVEGTAETGAKTEDRESVDCVCAQTHRAPGVPYPLFYPEFVIELV